MTPARSILPAAASLLVALLASLLSVPGAGCDDDAPRGTAVVSTRPAGPALDLEMKPLTPLLPNRPTHTTVDQLGNVYWVQETDRKDDTMFVIGEGGIPRATQLAAPNIGALLGVSEGARGNIQGIAAAADAGGQIYFYFRGVANSRAIACVGTFTPKTEQVRILADTDALAAATGMGRSLPLADGSVVSDGRIVWIRLWHIDNWAVFRIDASRIPTSGPAQLPRAFEAVTLEGNPVDMTREETDIAPAPGGALFVLDVPGARLLKVAPGGQATLVRSLVGLPKVLSTPSVDANQNLVLFAANAEPIGAKPNDIEAAAAASIDSTYPAMLVFKPDHVVSIGRDHMHAYPGFPVFGTRLRQLVPHPRAGGWVSYDAGSGELLRVEIVENLWR
jgi:hypothetical protein